VVTQNEKKILVRCHSSVIVIVYQGLTFTWGLKL